MITLSLCVCVCVDECIVNFHMIAVIIYLIGIFGTWISIIVICVMTYVEFYQIISSPVH